MRRALGTGGAAWVVLSALLCLGAIVVTALCGEAGTPPAAAPIGRALDWQPALGLREPWRLWTAAWVHGSAAHLLVNLAGGAVVGFVGWRARLPAAAALAWFAAWPGTHLLMAAIGSDRLAGSMPHYFGLSGVLHAGVAVLGAALAWPGVRAPALEPSRSAEGPGETELGAPSASPLPTRYLLPAPIAGRRPLRERWIGVAILAGTLAKVASEAPWHLAPRASEALGIAVAPIGHACGIAAGLLAWAALRLIDRGRR